MGRAPLAVLALLVAVPAVAKPPVWDRTIDSPKRFKVLAAFDGEAVLDQETGLVWSREPLIGTNSWYGAVDQCLGVRIGGRSGWRLPTAYEFRSLVDTVSQALPQGHSFAVADDYYWTATSSSSDPTYAYVGDLGNPSAQANQASKANQRAVWCVRGGLGSEGF
jgi:Protein of unknown function (DUF1566)